MTYTVQNICQRFNVNEHTVLSWIKGGELRALNVGVAPGKRKPRWRVTEDALAEFELLRTHNPPPKPTRRRKRDTAAIPFYS